MTEGRPQQAKFACVDYAVVNEGGRPSVLALKLKDGFAEKQFQKYRRRRRRIRSYFGSAENIAKASVTIASRQGLRGGLHGYILHLAGKSGVKGLKASEGYCRAADGHADPCSRLLHA